MLVPTAVQMVIVAFRTGLYVSGMADRLEAVDGATKSWTFVVPETDEVSAKAILHEFHASNVRYSAAAK
jgi:hypothetical protein